jgi:cobalt/nickel transport system ATP-binding protein
MEPNILVMDEPTAELDQKSIRKLIKLLKEFNHTRIITTHDMDMVWETCERTIIIKDGTIIADGLTKEILSNAQFVIIALAKLYVYIDKQYEYIFLTYITDNEFQY